MRFSNIPRTAVAAAICACAAATLNALDVVTDGKSGYSIIGDAASPAVKDLQTYIEKMSGAKLPIIPPSPTPPPKKTIYVGDAAGAAAERPPLAPQEYRLKVDGSRVLIIGGGPNGVSNGVYGLLDDHWGCRFLTVKEDFIPKSPTLSLPSDLSERRGPSIRDRLWIMTNGLMDNPDWRRRNRMTSEKSGYACHNLFQLLPPDKHFKEHQDWYPLAKDGLRKTSFEWLCWTNEEMLTELTKVIKEKMSKTPANQYIPVGQGDGFSNPCHCPKCRALVERYGSEAAPIVWGLNRVAAETVKEFPKHEMAFFAYFETLIPPVKGKEKLAPHPNLCATFVRTGDAMKNIESPGNSKELRERFLGWKTLTDNIQVWSWSVGFKNSLCPFPNYKVMGEDTKWYARNGARGLMHQMYGDGEWHVLRQWTLARLMWDASLDVESLQRDLLRHYYGEEAAKPLWSIIDKSQKAGEASTKGFNAVFGSDPKYVQDNLFPPEDMEFTRKAFEEAINAAGKSGDQALAERVKDTMARSFSMLLFAQPKPLRRVSVDGKEWMLPDGDARLALSAAKLSEVLKKTIMWEWFGPELGRRKFMNNAGGPMDIFENEKIKLGFCPAMDGVLCSLVDKESGAELLRVGPAGKGEQSGIHHMIKSSSASDHEVKVDSEADLTRVTLAGPAITWQWMVFPAFRHDRVYEFSKTRPGFSVKSFIYADSKNPAFGLYSIYKAPEYNLALDKPLYDPHVTMRFSAPTDMRLDMLTVSPKGAQMFQLDNITTLLVSLPAKRSPDETLTMFFNGVEPDKTLSIATPWSGWEKITVEVDKPRQEFILKFDGPKLASQKDIKTLASSFEVDLLTKEEAQRRTPIAKLSARDEGDSRPVITWERRQFNGFAGYHVHAAKGNGEFARLTKKPLLVPEWKSETPLEDDRWRFQVTVVAADGKEGACSPFISWRNPKTGGKGRPLLVANDGTGDCMTLQEAFDSLPKTEWVQDQAIQVLETSGEFPDGYDGAQVPDETIKAGKGRTLRLSGLGGKPRIRGTIDLNGKGKPFEPGSQRLTVTISGLCFTSPSDLAIESPGPGSLISGNDFIEAAKGIGLQSYSVNNGTIIERNFFHKNKESSIFGVGLIGGKEKEPMIIRDNIFSGGGLYVNGDWTYVVNNTFDDSAVSVWTSPSFTIANNIFANKSLLNMVYPRERYANSRQVIDGNVFHQTFPSVRFGGKPDNVTLAEAVKSGILGSANREAAPLWMAEEPQTVKPTDNIPQLQTERKPGSRPEYYKLRPNSPCLSGGVKGLPAGDLDYFGSKRDPENPAVGAVTTIEKR